MYTRRGAFLTREEKVKGTLEAGKLADMIVLPDNLAEHLPGQAPGPESGHDHRRRPRSLRSFAKQLTGSPRER